MTVDTTVARPAAASALAPYLHRYDSPAQLGLKINAYRGYEVEGLAEALRAPDLHGAPVECVMVGDSYFMTHLGRDGTTLSGADEQEWGLATLTGLVAEVRKALDTGFPADRRPFLLADLPDGTTRSTAAARAAADRFAAAGADAVKIEVAGEGEFDCIEAVAATGTPTLAHLGYTPQSGGLTRHGDALDGALALFAQARRARDAGGCGLIVEMVSEAVNQTLKPAAPRRSAAVLGVQRPGPLGRPEPEPVGRRRTPRARRPVLPADPGDRRGRGARPLHPGPDRRPHA